MKLTPKQKIFCQIYASNGGNGSDAARKAGYKNERVVASENLTKPDIAEYIAKLNAESDSLLIANREERQRFWTSVLRGEEPSKIDENGEPVFDMRDRLKASELLGRSSADFIEKRVVDVNVVSVAEQLQNLKEIAKNAE